MENLKFVFYFTLSHIIAYTIAGVIALKISKDIYESKSRHCDFLRDMGDKNESSHVQKYFLPAQIMRGIMMAAVLLPILDTIMAFDFVTMIIFFSGLMFVYCPEKDYSLALISNISIFDQINVITELVKTISTNN